MHIPSRRQLLTALASVPLAGAFSCQKTEEQKTRDKAPMTQAKLPAIFVPHGGGPWPFVNIPGFSDNMENLRQYLVGLPSLLPERPKAVVVISAHWEERVPTVQASAHPPMLYDYSGFPEESYSITWPAPGSPETAKQIVDLLHQNKIESAENTSRGYDHGAFVVTKLMYPDADIPTLQLSLTRDLNPARLFEIGQALAPLRDQGVLLLGSGYSYHNMRGFFSALRGDPGPSRDAQAFDTWLAETLSLEPSQRQTRLMEWEKAPAARACHPREEHLLPLMVCAGAAAESQVSMPFHEAMMGLKTLAAHFA